MTLSPLASRCAIAVLAKAPRPGFSKTRLVPPLIPEQAAALSAAFLRDTTENIALAATRAPIDSYVAYAPEGLEPLFDGHLADGAKLLLADGDGEMPDAVRGFGRCLLQAVRSLLESGYGAACVLNADGPTLPTARLVEAAHALLRPGERAVLGPSDDGGYYLLGMKSPHAHLFADIDWSSGHVARQTRERAAEAALDMVELAAWYDIDDAASLERLRAAGPVPRTTLEATSDAGAYPAPVTAAAIDRLGLRRLP